MERHLPRPRLLSPGLRYMLASALFFSLMSLAAKVAGQRLPTMELVFARAVVVSCLAGLDIARRRVPLRDPAGPLLLLRGVVGFAALTCFYYSVIHLPLAEATVIHFTNPVFTALVAAVLLGERLRPSEAALVALGLAGVAVVARPTELLAGAPSLPPLAVASALAGAFLAAVAYTLVRKLRRSDAMVIVLAFAAVSVVLALPIMVPVFVWPHGREWAVLAGLGLATFLGQVCMTLGLQRELAARATAMGYVQIVFAALWGGLAFAEVPGPSTVAGAVIIVGATLVLARVRGADVPPPDGATAGGGRAGGRPS